MLDISSPEKLSSYASSYSSRTLSPQAEREISAKSGYRRDHITGGINLAWVIKMFVFTALHQRSEDLGNPGIDLTLGHFPSREAGS